MRLVDGRQQAAMRFVSPSVGVGQANALPRMLSVRFSQVAGCPAQVHETVALIARRRLSDHRTPRGEGSLTQVDDSAASC
jgi:hypothetical protein